MTQQALRELVERRIPEALKRITDGYGLMRVPAEDTDPDLVLADCLIALKALLGEQREAQAAKIRELEKEFRETAETLAGTASAAGVLACADRLSAVIRGTKT